MFDSKVSFETRVSEDKLGADVGDALGDVGGDDVGDAFGDVGAGDDEGGDEVDALLAMLLATSAGLR